MQVTALHRNETDEPLPRLSSEFAPHWQLVSKPGEYAEEAVLWREAVRRRLDPGRHRRRALGVGVGHNRSHLTEDFAFTAADLAPAMIEQARRLNPDVEFHIGDMRTIRLPRAFDGVLIQDAISHTRTEEDLRAVFATAGAHLRPGGVFITAPDWFPGTFRSPRIECRSNTDGQTEFTSFEYTCDPDPSDTTIETLLWYLIREGGRELRIERDCFVCGLFPVVTWERLMTEAGFRVGKDPCDAGEGCGGLLLVGVRLGCRGN
jgi:SAM-dependent methyltransferase